MPVVLTRENTVSCKIFYTNLWVDFFPIWKYQEEIFDPAPEIGHKEMFSITLVETNWQLIEIWGATLSHDVTILHNYTLSYTLVAYTFANHLVINQRKNSPDTWMEKLFPWTENFKVLNWLMSQCTKTIVAKFFSKHIHQL